MSRRDRSIFSIHIVWMFFAVCAPAQLFAQDTSTSTEKKLGELVKTGRGELPIVISAPHGGTKSIPGVDESRKGEGMEAGPKGYFTGRDGGTEELAHDVVEAIEKRFGKKPYFVISSVHRKYLDLNRPTTIAYEDDDAQPVYQRYHHALNEYCKTIQEQHHAGLLIDIHGQGSKKDTVFRGTGNGRTVTRLRDRFGQQAFDGQQSLFGILADKGWTVFPTTPDAKEQSGFTGGFIVQTYGSQNAHGIDAMQFEFGIDYRDKAHRKQTAETLAAAIEEYAKLYLRIPN